MTKRKIIGILIVLIGIASLSYPIISNYIYEKNSSYVMVEYSDAVAELDTSKYDAMIQEAVDYNALLNTSAIITDPFSTAEKDDEETDLYESILDVTGTGIMGYISIDKIDVNLPIYHGTSEPVLQVGVGHIEGTSFPVSGESTHAVLSGHRGLPEAELFTNLDQLVNGDTFTITILNESYVYMVDQILTVEPDEVDSLGIVEGENYATLVTCTPYGVNSHRLLIRGTLIYSTTGTMSGEASDYNTDTGIYISLQTKCLIASLLVILILGVTLAFIKDTQKVKTRKARRSNGNLNNRIRK